MRRPCVRCESEIMLGKKQQHSRRVVQQQQLRRRACRMHECNVVVKYKCGCHQYGVPRVAARQR
eukprot:4103250-Pleurochrysis_carterae.AAC.4